MQWRGYRALYKAVTHDSHMTEEARHRCPLHREQSLQLMLTREASTAKTDPHQSQVSENTIISSLTLSPEHTRGSQEREGREKKEQIAIHQVP